MANTSTIQQLPNGQITLNIPRAIAQAMGYKKGDTVTFEIKEQLIVLHKNTAAPSRPH
jgi:antitoxin component of MazEF toxin-antitoxin module